MLTKLTVVIILQHVRVSNYYTVHLNLIHVICQLYLNKNGESALIDKKSYLHSKWLSFFIILFPESKDVLNEEINE